MASSVLFSGKLGSSVSVHPITAMMVVGIGPGLWRLPAQVPDSTSKSPPEEGIFLGFAHVTPSRLDLGFILPGFLLARTAPSRHLAPELQLQHAAALAGRPDAGGLRHAHFLWLAYAASGSPRSRPAAVHVGDAADRRAREIEGRRR